MEVLDFDIDRLPELIELMKDSLGENLKTRNEEFFIWKHVKNPFGVSRMIVMMDSDKIVGFRAFLNWEWRLGSDTITSFRPVDTLTDSDYRGKGIFRELTMKLVNEVKAENQGFIYNTPNKQSGSGYLKMGWQSRGRLPMTLLLNPFGQRRLKGTKTLLSAGTMNYEQVTRLKGGFTADMLVVNTTNDYLKWRYVDIPNLKYYHFTDTIDGIPHIAIYTVKARKYFDEVRICDLLYGEFSRKRLRRFMKVFHKHVGMAVISVAAKTDGERLTFRGWGFVTITKGTPDLFYRELAKDPAALNWCPDTGSLELF